MNNKERIQIMIIIEKLGGLYEYIDAYLDEEIATDIYNLIIELKAMVGVYE